MIGINAQVGLGHLAPGLLAREGLSCEIALTLAGRRNKFAFFARYSSEDEGAASRVQNS